MLHGLHTAFVHHLSEREGGRRGVQATVRCVDLAVDFTRVHFDAAISLSSVADATNVSPAHLSRRFRKATGTTVNGFILEMRMAAAQAMLANLRHMVKEVAHSRGFSSANHFCRAFRQRTGTTLVPPVHSVRLDSTGVASTLVEAGSGVKIAVSTPVKEALC